MFVYLVSVMSKFVNTNNEREVVLWASLWMLIKYWRSDLDSQTQQNKGAVR